MKENKEKSENILFISHDLFHRHTQIHQNHWIVTAGNPVAYISWCLSAKCKTNTYLVFACIGKR